MGRDGSGHERYSWGDAKVLKLYCVMVTKLYKFITNHCFIPEIREFYVCKLNVNKTVKDGSCRAEFAKAFLHLHSHASRRGIFICLYSHSQIDHLVQNLQRPGRLTLSLTPSPTSLMSINSVLSLKVITPPVPQIMPLSSHQITVVGTTLPLILYSRNYTTNK